MRALKPLLGGDFGTQYNQQQTLSSSIARRMACLLAKLGRVFAQLVKGDRSFDVCA
jgi:hypothetical protein